MVWSLLRLALENGSKENREGLLIQKMLVMKLQISVEKQKKDFALIYCRLVGKHMTMLQNLTIF